MGVAEAYTTRPNKEKTSKVLYIYLAWRVDRWETEEHICAPTPAQEGGGGGGGTSLAWVGATMMPLQGSPQASRSEA